MVRTGEAFKGTELGEVLVPALFPLSSRHPDDAVKLGRATVWAEEEGEPVPYGQKTHAGGWRGNAHPGTAASLRSPPPNLPRNTMPLRNDLLNPISEDKPSGENLRYAPVYDKIKEARREDDDAPQGLWQRERKVADWPLTIKLIGETLATKTKDLQLVAWLTEAMLKREGIGRAARISRVVPRHARKILGHHCYPELEDGDAELRAGPLQWVGDRLEIPLKQSGHHQIGAELVPVQGIARRRHGRSRQSIQ